MTFSRSKMLCAHQATPSSRTDAVTRQASLVCVAFLVLQLIACTSKPSPQVQTGRNTPSRVAQAELQNIRQAPNWAALGLGSPDEAGKATLGPPIAVYFARVDELSRYSGGDLRGLLHQTNNIIYPVLVGGHGRLLIEVGKENGQWKPVRDGYQDSAEPLGQFINSSEGSVFVKVPSLNESNILITGKREAAPGASATINEPTQVEGLSGTLQVHPLNQQSIDASEATQSRQRRRGRRGNVPFSAPGVGAPSNSAEEYFRSVAPAAKKAATSAGSGPA
jgi:hypothetical protein